MAFLSPGKITTMEHARKPRTWALAIMGFGGGALIAAPLPVEPDRPGMCLLSEYD